MQIDGGGSRKVLVRAVLAGTECSGDGVVSNFHDHGNELRRAPVGASVHETEGKRARVSAVFIRMRVRARKEGMGECGVAAMLDLNGGSGCSEHALLAVPW